MCRCKYPKVINKKGISITQDKNKERCYKISFEIAREGKEVLIISRAPKPLELESCNCVYRRVIKFIQHNSHEFEKVRKVTFVNLFVLYEYDRAVLYEQYLLNGRDYIEGNDQDLYNNKIIAEEIEKADYVISAWGEPLEGLDEIYPDRVELILKALRRELMKSQKKKRVVRVGDISKKGYPKHCLAWSYKDEIKPLFF